MLLSNLWYDRLKWVAIIGIPALGTLYFTLSRIWGFPFAEEILGSIMAVDVCLGTLLGLSTRKYNQQ